MPLHFTDEEFERRRRRTLVAMEAARLDALLMFKPESHYWLTGYDTFGYCFFQCLVLRADGELVLLTRAPDLRQARHTSLIGDIRIWVDGAVPDPGTELKALLSEKGLAGKQLGVERDTHGLTAAAGRRLDASLDGFAEAVDASDLVSRLRVVKSAEELAYVRKAAGLADAALDAAIHETRRGAFEGDILAAMHAAVFRGGGDYPGNPFIIGSGPEALLCRYQAGRRTLDAEDQLTLEFAGVFRHYHACMMRTLLVGAASERHKRMHEACVDSLHACEETLRPGCTFGEVFDAHARVLDGAGFGAHRLNACGYSLGATYAPSWMDWPMFHAGNSVVVEPGMVLFVHIILMDSDSGTAMSLGRSSVITENGPELLSARPIDLVVR
jgi:Xaa-Pro dipeptidase